MIPWSDGRNRGRLALSAAVVTILIAGTAWSTPSAAQRGDDARARHQRDRDDWIELIEPLQRLKLRPAITLRGDLWGSRRLARRALDHGDELGLTEEQETRIRDAMRAFRRDEIRRDADIEVAELELGELLEDATADLDEVEASMRDLASLRVDARIAELRHERAVEELLTAEQLDELEEMSPFPAFLRGFGVRHHRDAPR